MDNLLNLGPGFTVLDGGELSYPSHPLLECNYCGNEFYWDLEGDWKTSCPSCGIEWRNT